LPLTPPTISVIIPAHNGEKYIVDTVTSILEQSLAPDEIIISDDGSDDKTVPLVQSLVDTSEIVKLVTTEPNGISNNYLNALKRATGDLIIVGDHDDWWKADKIKIIAEKFSQDASLALLSSDSEVVDQLLNPQGSTLRGGAAISTKLSKLCEENDFQQFLQGLRLDAHTLAFRACIKPLVFSEQFSSIDQFWFEDKVVFAAMAVGKLAYLAESLTLYRQHSSQHTGASGTSQKRYEDKNDRNRQAKLNLLLSLLKDDQLPQSILSASDRIDRAAMLEDYMTFIPTRKISDRDLATLKILISNLISGRYHQFTRRSLLSFAKDLFNFIRGHSASDSA